ncbi:hypothetical protein Trydic_g20407 [Trypoxylus dichotomus]
MGNTICCCGFSKCSNADEDSDTQTEPLEIVAAQPTASNAENQLPKPEPTLVVETQIDVNVKLPEAPVQRNVSEIMRVTDLQMAPIRQSNIDFIFKNINDYARSELNWQHCNEYLVRLLPVHPNTWEYRDVAELFYETGRHLGIISIDRIQNPFLLAAFLLKKAEMEKKIGVQTVERLFHGTQARKVPDICRNNFDWRLRNKDDPLGFGDGVYFTPSTYIASFYGDNNPYERVMLLVHVLIGEMCFGNWDMILPEEGTDTSVKYNGKEFVKYEDNEFYPAYKITYKFNNVRTFHHQQWKKKQVLARARNYNRL